jgi:uncharacterized protein (TIGR02145 family)
MKINKLRIGIFIFLCLIIVSMLFCNKENEIGKINTDPKQVEKNIIASDGGTLSISDSIKLFIPPNALPVNGKVFLGQTGNEPTSVPNKNIQIVGNPITIRFPSESILKPVELSIPRTSNAIDTISNFIFLYNGTTYFPVEYSINGETIVVTIDKIDWESEGKKGVEIVGDIVIFVAKIKQSMPEVEMGLKKVLINSVTKEIDYHTPTANSSSNILLLIHGWTADPTCWKEFLPWIMSDMDSLYSEFWTFGYNSSWSINQNGELLSNLIKTYSNGAHIDIVGHSMGGLVSRSMIEKYNGAVNIRKLITLGTPHEGSPLAVLRYAIGALVAMDSPFQISTYNYNTQGFDDLNTFSNFITEMKKLSNPAIQYYTIAATNDPAKHLLSIITSNILPGLDDGVVSVSSAHGVSGAVSPEIDNLIPVGFAHIEMPSNRSIYEQVLFFLRLGIPTVETSIITNISQTFATVGGNVSGVSVDTITERGVYWGKSTNPETSGAKLQIGYDTGSFSGTLSNLTPNTLYYVKAYAINSYGTFYGDQERFITSSIENSIIFNPNLTYGNMSDVDGNTYKTIQIGTQTWMAENLKTTRYCNGDIIGTTTPATLDIFADTMPKYQWAYEGNGSNVNTYGRLYTRYAMTDIRGVCPIGWHLPTDAEWTTLTTFLGGYMGAGGKLKETGTTHWSTPNEGATNESGFTALPGGNRVYSGGSYGAIGLVGVWWTSEYAATLGWLRSIDYSSTSESRGFGPECMGLSVRCLKDN